MNSAESEPALIGIDWGTSSLRAFLIDGRGEVLDSRSTPQGIMSVQDREFGAVLDHLIEPWSDVTRLPIIASGMITSRNGWVETPYLNVPSGSKDLADALVSFETTEGHLVNFVTGMTTDHNGAPDVMRGEETQIVGASAIGIGDGLFVLPGTHSKWISVSQGSINDYTTFMTGELFALLSSGSILGKLMEDGPFNKEGFELGVQAGLEEGGNLLHDLFQVRTLPLFGKIAGDMVEDYLSGLLIGTEIRAAISTHPDASCLTIVGGDELTERYEAALEIAGFDSQRAPENIVAQGHFAIAKSAGLVS